MKDKKEKDMGGKSSEIYVKVNLDTGDLERLARMAGEIAKTAEALQRQSAEFAQACVEAYENPSLSEA